MRILATLLVVSVFFLTFFAFSIPSASSDTSGCRDSTVVPTHLFGWDLTGDPYGIVVGTNGFVYVADAINDQICRYSLYGGGALCWGTTGNGDGEFNEPRWLAWNPVNNRLYVSEQIGARVQVFDPDGSFIFSIENDTLSTDPGKFAGDTGAIAVDPLSGNVYVHENNTLNSVTVDRIQEFDLGGVFTGRVINNGSVSPPPACGSWFGVWDMAVDSTGSIYVLDNAYPFYPSAVHRLDPSGGCIALWGHQSGLPGELLDPDNIAVDRDGFVYVMNHSAAGSEVYKYSRTGNYINTLQADLANEYIALDLLKQGPVTFLYATRYSATHRAEVFGDGIEARNILETQWVDENNFRLKTGGCPVRS
jgi:DNA-binding beta-propeller fold protein YncE